PASPQALAALTFSTRPLQVAAVVVALVAAHRHTPVLRLDPPSTITPSGWLLWWYDERTVRAELAAAPPDLPLVIAHMGGDSVGALLCDRSLTIRAWSQCVTTPLCPPGSEELTSGWQMCRHDGREVARLLDGPLPEPDPIPSL